MFLGVGAAGRDDDGLGIAEDVCDRPLFFVCQFGNFGCSLQQSSADAVFLDNAPIGFDVQRRGDDVDQVREKGGAAGLFKLVAALELIRDRE